MNLTADVSLSMGGDREAYSRVVRQTMRLVSTIALSHVSDVAASEDIAQEVFVHAWWGLRKLRAPESFLPWLRQLTRNRAQDYVRTRYRHRKVGALEGDDVLHAVADSRLGPLEQAQRDEENKAVLAALENLPNDAREVLTLFYREGQSVAQVASLLELSEGAVKKRLSRARGALKDELENSAAELFQATSPGESFHAAVLAAIPAGPVLGAAGVVTSLAAKAGPLALLSGLAGPLFALVGLLAGHRKNTARAVDDVERAELRRLRNVGVALILGVALVIVVAMLVEQPWLIVIGIVIYMAAMTFGWTVPFMRLRRRKHALLLEADPTLGAKLEARRRRANAWAALGMLGGSAALAFAIWVLTRS